MDAMKNQIRTPKIMAINREDTEMSLKLELESEKSSSTVLSPTISSISQISPRTKKPKLDKDSGVESLNLSDNECQKLQPSMDFLEVLRRNQSRDRLVDSDKLVAPPSSPVTSPSTPRCKDSSMDMNISSSIKSGIFEKRKKFFEKNKLENVRPRKTRSESSSSSTSSCSCSSDDINVNVGFTERNVSKKT